MANQKLEEVLNELGREQRLQDCYLGEVRGQRTKALKVGGIYPNAKLQIPETHLITTNKGFFRLV
ncbi:hypothetical protein N9769_01195 [Ascidiaceihabitans sp.]|nr:hypothetical protein [Ascidiaceihabitans sp.]